MKPLTSDWSTGLGTFSTSVAQRRANFEISSGTKRAKSTKIGHVQSKATKHTFLSPQKCLNPKKFHQILGTCIKIIQEVHKPFMDLQQLKPFSSLDQACLSTPCVKQQNSYIFAHWWEKLDNPVPLGLK